MQALNPRENDEKERFNTRDQLSGNFGGIWIHGYAPSEAEPYQGPSPYEALEDVNH